MPNVSMDAAAEANLALLSERWGIKPSAATREAIRRAALDVECEEIGYTTTLSVHAERARRELTAKLLPEGNGNELGW